MDQVIRSRVSARFLAALPITLAVLIFLSVPAFGFQQSGSPPPGYSVIWPSPSLSIRLGVMSSAKAAIFLGPPRKFPCAGSTGWTANVQ